MDADEQAADRHAAFSFRGGSGKAESFRSNQLNHALQDYYETNQEVNHGWVPMKYRKQIRSTRGQGLARTEDIAACRHVTHLRFEGIDLESEYASESCSKGGQSIRIKPFQGGGAIVAAG